MTVIGPYRLLRTLGGGDAGKVWSAFAADGTSVTVAMIDPARAGDPRWMYQFQSGTNELVRDGMVEVVAADLSSPTPWVACAWDDSDAAASVLFTAQGLTYAPADAAGPIEVAPAKLSRRQARAERKQAAGYDYPATIAPQSPVPPSPVPPFAGPVDAPTQEVPAVPQQPVDPPMMGQPSNGAPQFATPPPVLAPPSVVVPPPMAPPAAVQPPTVTGGVTPVRGRGISDPGRIVMPQGPTAPADYPVDDTGPGRKKRRGLRVLVTLTIVLVVLGGAGFAAVRTGVADKLLAGTGILPGSTPTPAAPTTPADIRGPGKEPPAAGDWPLTWAKYSEADATRQVKDLPGVGFTFRIKDTWSCDPGSTIRDAAHYVCGTASGGVEIGGDLEVRACPDGCDAATRVQMRMVENAWRLQWTRAGSYVTWTETNALPEPSTYGLVVVLYWRSVPTGPVDRQTVVRMIAPPLEKVEVQKVANDIYDALK